MSLTREATPTRRSAFAEGGVGYRTSYLWERVWQPEAWLDLIRRFLHVENADGDARRKSVHDKAMIFPRYHQWHAVRALTEHAGTHGSGHNYLVQHSAGSGKSNTIAWLAHRLSNLHSDANEPVFDKVVVITDRSVLDTQLQDTIYQFEHRAGVVKKISNSDGAKSGQVAQALAGETTKILIVTLQTFPHVLEKVSGLRGKRFAVIVDEAHSSQSGESSAALKKVLLRLGSDDVDEDGDLLTASALARGRHETLSYFAFTATPKAKTLELFGTPHPATGNLRPFHVYSMRQGIEEGFILDVLANYVTYRTYWKLSTANPDDRDVDQRKAAAQLAWFAVLHATSLGQRAEIIMDHFHDHIRGSLGGRAKAMVVTSSRDHAVRLYRKLVAYRDTRGYDDCGVLVAFSGELAVAGLDDDTVTEAGINGFAEDELPKRFGYTPADDPHANTNPKAEYRIVVVADKYQTGFDQPLLTTMYVDKKLRNVAAVQTLSRLNRTRPGKSQEDLLVLDLANEAEDIREAFKPFYETTTTEPTDPNLLYTAQRQVMDFALLVESEMEAFAVAYLAAEGTARTDAQWQRAHADLYRHTEPARDRFAQLLADDPKRAEEFRGALQGYVRKYGFLSQVVSYHDRELERLYVYGRLLLTRLDRREDPGVDLGEVDLTHLRITRTGEHDVSLSPEGEQVLPGFTGDGAGRRNDPEQVSLSELIADLNDRFGVNLSDDDLVGGSARAAMGDPRVKAAAAVNSEADFAHVFDGVRGQAHRTHRGRHEGAAEVQRRRHVQERADPDGAPLRVRGAAPRRRLTVADRGQVITRRYELTAPVGRGGMGEVWAAYDAKLDRRVDLKLVRPDLLPSGTSGRSVIARFKREARLTARLEHPGVPAVFDVGDHDGLLYLVWALAEVGPGSYSPRSWGFWSQYGGPSDALGTVKVEDGVLRPGRHPCPPAVRAMYAPLLAVAADERDPAVDEDLLIALGPLALGERTGADLAALSELFTATRSERHDAAAWKGEDLTRRAIFRIVVRSAALVPDAAGRLDALRRAVAYGPAAVEDPILAAEERTAAWRGVLLRHRSVGAWRRLWADLVAHVREEGIVTRSGLHDWVSDRLPDQDARGFGHNLDRPRQLSRQPRQPRTQRARRGSACTSS